MPVNEAKFRATIETAAQGDGANVVAQQMVKLKAAAEGASISHHELHQALRLIAENAGGALGPLGELAHMLGNPYILAAAGATMAIKMLVDAHQALKESHEKGVALTREFKQALTEASEAADRMAGQGLRDYNNELRKHAENLDLSTEAMKRNIEQAKEMLAVTESQLTAQLALNEAKIKEAEALGQLTSPEANRAAQEAKEKEAREKQAAKEKEEQDEIDLKRQRASEATNEAADADSRARSLAAPGGQRDRQQHAVLAQDKIIEDLKKPLDELEKAATPAAAELARRKQEMAEADKKTRENMAASYARTGAREYSPAMAEEAIKEAHQQAQARNDALQRTVDAATHQHEAVAGAMDTKSRLEQDLQDTKDEIAKNKDKVIKSLDIAKTNTDEADARAVKLKNDHADAIQQQATDADTARTTRRAGLEDKVSKGTATRDEIIELQAAGEGAGAASKDIKSANVKAADLVKKLSRQRPQDRDAGDVAQLHQILDAMAGYVENNNAHVRELANQNQALREKMQRIDAQQQSITQLIEYHNGNTQ